MDSQSIKESNMLSLNDDLPNELNEELSPLKSIKSSRLIKGTIISQEHEHRVKQEDYPFYASPDDEEFERILEQFQPDLDDRFLFYNTDEQLRLIFGSDEKYSDREEIQYQTFIKYCVCIENKLFIMFDTIKQINTRNTYFIYHE